MSNLPSKFSASSLKNYVLSLSKTLKPSSPLLSLLLKTNLLPLNTSSLSPPLVIYNSIISSFSHSHFHSLSLQTFSLLHHLSFPLDSYSICSSLVSAISVTQYSGNTIHSLSLKASHLSNVFVCGALIDYYAKSGYLEDAHKVFDEIHVKNIVCANSLMNSYFEKKLWNDGISFFRRIHFLGLEPNVLTLCCVLRICGEVSIIGLGMQVHAYLTRKTESSQKDMFLLSSLIEMYGKCGLVSKALLVFESTKLDRDIVLWTSMINACGRNGMFDEVIRLYEEMLKETIKPDKVVFLTVISACARSGNVHKGLKYFDCMRKDYGLMPESEHYGCVIDMLCKAGELEIALKLVDEGSDGGNVKFGVSVWGAILTACKNCGNVDVGNIAAKKALEMEGDNVGIYMELSNLYAKFGMWDEIVKLREVMKVRGLKKDVGFSWLD